VNVCSLLTARQVADQASGNGASFPKSTAVAKALISALKSA
jgi:hypothetical protein